MALSILRPLMYFLILRLVLQKKAWFHLAQWFQRGLIVKVYRGQWMSSCSNTSHNCYNLHQSCVPDLYHTTEWLFRGWGKPPKKEGHLGVWQLWKKNIKVVRHIALTWHPLSKILDFNLLLWNHLANWNRTWYECSLNGFLQNLCCCFKTGCFHIIYGF